MNSSSPACSDHQETLSKSFILMVHNFLVIFISSLFADIIVYMKPISERAFGIIMDK